MRGFIQIVCVLAIAVGAGLLGFSNKLQPPFNSCDSPPATAHDGSDDRQRACFDWKR